MPTRPNVPLVSRPFVTIAVLAGAASAFVPGYPCIGPCPGYPLPPRRLGYPLLGSPLSDVRLEIFGDNLCAYTKASWPTIKALAAHYQGQKASLEIRVHWFPLPYHHNAFFVAMADHWIGSHKGPATLFAFAEAIFGAQETLLGGAANLTEPEVHDRIADLAESVGVNRTEFVAQMTNHTTDLVTRVGWKLAATRGVYETPTFFLNGFRVAEPDKANTGVANITGWTALIDPLLITPPDLS
mmetsp:Transcript_3092/g.7400  ORF Transcript_3092/g.7400 Transcript_3092/m.7400 type:complete len:241 (+) Transcript_3092:159-881(+)